MKRTHQAGEKRKERMYAGRFNNIMELVTVDIIFDKADPMNDEDCKECETNSLRLRESLPR